MQERRRLPRHELLKRAKIAFEDQSSMIDCTVRNLTNDGACLECTTTMQPTGMLALSFDNFRSFRSCRVIWQEGNVLAVSFRH